MKKILVVLLILAVAGGVFAQQGEWSVSGGIAIGTRVDFDPDPDVDDIKLDPALVDGISDQEWDRLHGNLEIHYVRDSFNIGLGFATKGETFIDTSFNGESFRGQFKVDGLLALINNVAYNDDSLFSGYHADRGLINRLWGEFKFFDGIITLVPAYASPDTEYWASDKTGAFKDKINPWKFVANPFGGGDTFTKVDHDNYLLADVGLGALSFGVMVPNLFLPDNGGWASYGKKTGNAASTKFIDGTLKQMKLGVKFEQSPFEFAAQFKLDSYGVYFGGKFFAGPITVGLSFMGILDGDGQDVGADADPKQVKIGGKVEYAGDGFGGGLQAFYESKELGMITNLVENFSLTTIGVEPSFFYDAIPSHLRFKLDAGIYFFNETDGNNSIKATAWALQPAIFWNFLGTGATDSFWWGGTGIIVRYRLANADVRELTQFASPRSESWETPPNAITGPATNNSVNFVDVIFRWCF